MRILWQVIAEHTIFHTMNIPDLWTLRGFYVGRPKIQALGCVCQARGRKLYPTTVEFFTLLNGACY
jgi:hypothetical protein